MNKFLTHIYTNPETEPTKYTYIDKDMYLT